VPAAAPFPGPPAKPAPAPVAPPAPPVALAPSVAPDLMKFHVDGDYDWSGVEGRTLEMCGVEVDQGAAVGVDGHSIVLQDINTGEVHDRIAVTHAIPAPTTGDIPHVRVHVTEQREIVLLERSPAPVTVVVFQAGTPGNVRAKWTATACPVAPPDW